MNDVEILEKLIALYEQALIDSKVAKDVLDLRFYLSDHAMQFGICHAAQCNFDVDISHKTWLLDNVTTSVYWYAAPHTLRTLEAIIFSIQFRLETMKKIYDKLNMIK